MVTLITRPEVNRAKSVLRPFLQLNPGLPALVRAEHLAGAFGRTPNPTGVAIQALSQEPNSGDLCQILASPVGQFALQELAVEFPPPWGLVFQFLPVAAQAICRERSGQLAVSPALALGALLLGAWFVLYAVSGKKPAS